jgi:hypothetical protein
MTGPSMTLADRLQEATEGMSGGEWRVNDEPYDPPTGGHWIDGPDYVDDGDGANWFNAADARAIAFFGTHVAEIVAALRAGEKARDALRDWVDAEDESIRESVALNARLGTGEVVTIRTGGHSPLADARKAARSLLSQPSPSSEEAPAP